MTAPDLDALERAAQEATQLAPGQWHEEAHQYGHEPQTHFVSSSIGPIAEISYGLAGAEMAVYIAAANPAAILSLIAEVREMRRQALPPISDQDRARHQQMRDDGVFFSSIHLEALRGRDPMTEGVLVMWEVCQRIIAQQRQTIREAERQRDEARAALENDRAPLLALRVERRVNEELGGDATVDEIAVIVLEELRRNLSALPPPAGSETGGV